MTITVEHATGSAVTISTTEWSLVADSSTLATSTDAGVFPCLLDLNALAVGDVFEFKCYEKVITGGTKRLLASARFANVQSQPLWGFTPPVPLGIGWDYTLIKITGTDRAVSWRISKVS